MGSYRFAHELIRDVVYTELGEARRHLLHQRALPHGEHTLELAQAIHDKELEARSLCSLGVIHLFAGDFQEAIHRPQVYLLQHGVWPKARRRATS